MLSGWRATFALAVLTVSLVLAFSVGAGAEPKVPYDSFGGPGAAGQQFDFVGSVAVNSTGAGSGADPGDVYVVDRGSNRIQQFHPKSDEEGNFFVRAFGVDVGGPGVDLCTVAVSCQAGAASSAAGGMNAPQGIAINQENGSVFVTDPGNRRVDVFSSDGSFQGAFGWGVDTGAAALEFCTTVSACQAPAAAGGAAGQFNNIIGYPAIAPAGAPNAGNLVIADASNARIDEFSFSLNGDEEVTGASFVRAMGWDVVASGPDNANQIVNVTVSATSGTFNLSFGVGGIGVGTTIDLPHDATAGEVQAALNALTNINGGGGSVVVEGGPGNAAGSRPYGITFAGSLANKANGPITAANGATPLAGGTAGEALKVTTLNTGGTTQYEVCDIASNPTNVCKAGSPGGDLGRFTAGAVFPGGSAPSQVNGLRRVAVDTAGSIYAVNRAGGGTCNATSNHCHVQKFSAATAVAEFSPGPGPGQLDFTSGNRRIVAASDVAVDPANGEVYVLRPDSGNPANLDVLHFDSNGVLLDKYSASIFVPSGGSEETPSGLALDSASGNLYITSTVEGSEHVYILVDPPPPPVAITGAASKGVNFALQKLEGMVNPEGFRVVGCRFEYGTTTAYGSSTPCVPAALGEGTSFKAVVAETEPLKPETTFHYRLVAEGAAANSAGDDMMFTTGPAIDGCTDPASRERRTEQGVQSLLLPGCMALEMASPPRKAGQQARWSAVSASGERVKFRSVAALGETPGVVNPGGDSYVATRGGSEWGTAATTPGNGIVKLWGSQKDPSFSEGFSRWFQVGATKPQYQVGDTQALHLGLGGFFSPLSPVLEPIANGESGIVEKGRFQGASADRSHLYIEPGGSGTGGSTRTAYLGGDPQPNGPGSDPNVYIAHLDESGNPALSLLAKDRAGKIWGASCGARLGGIGPTGSTSNPARNGERNQGAVAPDGSLVYFSARASQPEGGACIASSKLRILERRETASGPWIGRLFTSECDRGAPACATFDGDDFYQGGSVDQTKVYFTTNRQLADTDLDGSAVECNITAAVAGCDLYLYDSERPDGEQLVQISAGEELGAGVHELGKEAKVFNGITAISGDGSRAYFVAEGVLTDDESPEEEMPLAGQPNFYVWSADSESLSFIGTLDAGDSSPESSVPGLWGGEGTWRNEAYPVPVLGKEEGSEVGGDGHLLFFQSKASLTSDDADGGRSDAFRYDSESDTMECLSCRPGAEPDAEPFDVVARGVPVAPPGTDFAEINRWVSEDGQTLAFTTPEGLVPGDVNGSVDHYLWRDGELVFLPGRPYTTTTPWLDGPFLSHDGSVVAFQTFSRLLPSDIDTSADIYVVRENGGFAEAHQADPCTPDGGAGCQGAAPSAPSAPSAGSTAVVPPETALTPRPCNVQARKAQRLSQRAKRLRRNAKRVRGAKKARRMRGKSKRLAQRARGFSRNAKRCRQSNRRAGG